MHQPNCLHKIFYFTKFQLKCIHGKRLPFDWRNPLTYLVAIGIQYAMTSYAVKIGACVIALGISSFLYVIASSKCFKENLSSIDTIDKIDQNTIWDQFIEFIEFHSHMKQLSVYKYEKKFPISVTKSIIFVD